MTNPIDTIKRVRELSNTGMIPKIMNYSRLGQLVEAIDPYHRFCDMRGWGHLTGGAALNLDADKAAEIQDARGRLVAMLPTMATLIEEQAALIKQMREALLAAERSLHTACIMVSRTKVDDGGVEELLHYGNQVEAHVAPAWTPVAEALELSAPYEELEDL